MDPHALALHALLRSVSENAVRALVVFTALGAGIMMLNSVLLFEGMRVATGAVDVSALGTGATGSVALLLLDAQHYGDAASAVFMGLWLMPLGYLVHKSPAMFPKWLGIALVVGGVGYLLKVLAAFLWPEFAVAIDSLILWPATIAEVGTIVSLFVHAAKAPSVGARMPVAA